MSEFLYRIGLWQFSITSGPYMIKKCEILNENPLCFLVDCCAEKVYVSKKTMEDAYLGVYGETEIEAKNRVISFLEKAITDKRKERDRLFAELEKCKTSIAALEKNKDGIMAARFEIEGENEDE